MNDSQLAPTTTGARPRLLRLEGLEDRTVPSFDAFQLHSQPFARHVIYLDFDGHTTTGTQWNSDTDPIVETPAFDLDGDSTTFTTEELERIEHIWQRVRRITARSTWT